MLRSIALTLIGLTLLTGCASARLGAVHRADRGVLVADADAPIVAIVTERGVRKLPANWIVPMHPASRWAVVGTTSTGARWVPWKRRDPQGAGMILTLADVRFVALDLDTGATVDIPHGFNADDLEIRDACVSGEVLLVELVSRFRARAPEHHGVTVADAAWRPVTTQQWEAARRAARSEVKSSDRFASSVDVGGWGRLVQTDRAMHREIVLVRDGKPDLVVLRQNDTADR